VADLATKLLVVEWLAGDTIHVLGDAVLIRETRNPGAAFSLGTSATLLLSLVSIGVGVWIVRIARRVDSAWWGLALGLVLGGAIGNLVDRLLRAPGPLRGHVVDFVDVGWWPVFNVADSAIVVGGVLAGVLLLRNSTPDGGPANGDTGV
jgi:signal peptidase II